MYMYIYIHIYICVYIYIYIYMCMYTYIIDHHGCWLKIHHMFSQVLCVFDGHGVDGHWPAQRITESWCGSVARVTSWGVLEMGGITT